MSRYRRNIDKKLLMVLVCMLAVLLVATAAVGVIFGNDKTGSPSAPTNTADPGNTGTEDPSDPGQPEDPPENGGQEQGQQPSDPDPNSGYNPFITDPEGLTPKQLAAQMQDYSIDPTTGMAKEIKVVDDNYLLLVNRTHALSSDYAPDDMVTVKYVVSGVGKKGETDKLRKAAAEAFEAMVEAAAKEGIDIKMRTGYRSYAYQRDKLYNVYVKNNGQVYADTISAKPGQSEHQTGLALDVGGKSEKYALSRKFGDTKEGKWVAAHCHEYGFIIRYTDGTKDKPGPVTGFISEPWHLRYVGVEPAAEIHESGQLLEEYLGVLK